MVYYVLDAEYLVYMDIQQAVNLSLCRRFAEQKVEIAYPTQTIFMGQAAGAR